MRARQLQALTRSNNPPHPGEIRKDTVVRSDGGLSVTEFARRLGVSRVALSRVVNGRAAVSAGLARRLAVALRGSAESWLRMQVSYDLRSEERRVGKGGRARGGTGDAQKRTDS